MKAFKSVVSFLAGHPTASNLLMVLFLALGAISIGDLKRETFPDFSVDAVEITAVYPGATAEDVEASVCRRIEDAVDTVSYISEVKSTAMENAARVVVEMETQGDIIQFFNDIKTEVEAVSDFPDQLEDLIVKRINRVDPVVSIAVTGPMSPVHLKLYCEELKDRLKRLELISQVEIKGFSDHEFLVEIPFYEMMRLGLSVADIEAAVASQNIDLPAGSLKTRDSDILIRFPKSANLCPTLGSWWWFLGRPGPGSVWGIWPGYPTGSRRRRIRSSLTECGPGFSRSTRPRPRTPWTSWMPWPPSWKRSGPRRRRAWPLS